MYRKRLFRRRKIKQNSQVTSPLPNKSINRPSLKFLLGIVQNPHWGWAHSWSPGTLLGSVHPTPLPVPGIVFPFHASAWNLLKLMSRSGLLKWFVLTPSGCGFKTPCPGYLLCIPWGSEWTSACICQPLSQPLPARLGTVWLHFPYPVLGRMTSHGPDVPLRCPPS